MRLSASRSASLGRDTLRVSTLKTIHLVVDGQVIDGVSSAATVRDALRDIGLVLERGRPGVRPARRDRGRRARGPGDPREHRRRDRDRGRAVRVPGGRGPRLVKGNKVIATKGKAGVRTTTYELQVVGGVVTGRTPIASVVTVAPVTQVTKVGTAELPDPSVVAVEPGTAQALGKELAAARGWGDDQFACLLSLWNQESGWRVNAENKSSGAYGIPQALPGSKMATVGADWRTNPATQITWGLNYIGGRYGDPCGACAHSRPRAGTDPPASGWQFTTPCDGCSRRADVRRHG